jgi:hypothetical protein
MPYRKETEMKEHKGPSIIGAVLLFLLAAILSAAPSQAAVLADLTDAELANVTGQSGITIWTNGEARLTIDAFGFTDSLLLHSLELHNIVVGDSSLSSINDGGYFSWGTPLRLLPWMLDPAHDPAALALTFKPVTIDVGTFTVPIQDINGKHPGDPGYIPTTTNQTLVVSQDSTHVSPRWYSVGYWTDDPTPVLVGGIVFCNDYPLCSANYSLGTLNLDALSVGPSLQRWGAHADGTMGIDFDYSTTLYAQALRYTYNNTLQALALSGIHLAGSTTGSPEDPQFTILPTNFSTYYAGDPIKSLYTWPANRVQILSDPKVLDGTIAGPSFTSLVTNFLTYYAGDPIKSLYTWPANRAQILSDSKVLDGTIAGADPWVFSGNLKIGNIGTGNPAKIDVGTDAGTGTPTLYLNLPMQGTLGVENVTFGGNNFGPIAIDGINVHHLNVKISGGS